MSQSLTAGEVCVVRECVVPTHRPSDSLLMPLVWKLKASVSHATVDDPSDLLHVVRAWCDVMRIVDVEAMCNQFLASWPSTRHQQGDRPIDALLMDALLMPLIPLPGKKTSALLQDVTRLCRVLSRGGQFFLGQQTAALMLDCTQPTVSKHLRWLRRQRLLYRVLRGTSFSRKASEYLWTGKES